jgi:hypothetical protein
VLFCKEPPASGPLLTSNFSITPLTQTRTGHQRENDSFSPSMLPASRIAARLYTTVAGHGLLRPPVAADASRPVAGVGSY